MSDETEELKRRMGHAIALHRAFSEKLLVRCPDLVPDFHALMAAHRAVVAALSGTTEET